MELSKCPHLISVVCPHYQEACKAESATRCHYVIAMAMPSAMESRIEAVTGRYEERASVQDEHVARMRQEMAELRERSSELGLYCEALTSEVQSLAAEVAARGRASVQRHDGACLRPGEPATQSRERHAQTRTESMAYASRGRGGSGEKEATAHWERQWRWEPGLVDTSAEHIELIYGGSEAADAQRAPSIAILSPPVDQRFSVQFLMRGDDEGKRAIMEQAKRELDFYLVELGKPKPWDYAKYHCTTAANLCADIHWKYHPAQRGS